MSGIVGIFRRVREIDNPSCGFLGSLVRFWVQPIEALSSEILSQMGQYIGVVVIVDNLVVNALSWIVGNYMCWRALVPAGHASLDCSGVLSACRSGNGCARHASHGQGYQLSRNDGSVYLGSGGSMLWLSATNGWLEYLAWALYPRSPT